MAFEDGINLAKTVAMKRLRVCVYLIGISVVGASLLAHTSHAFGSRPQGRIMNEFQRAGAYLITVDHLNRTHRKYSSEIVDPRKPLFANHLTMLASMIASWESELHLCGNTAKDDEDRVDCILENVTEFLQKTPADQDIDSTVKKAIELMSKTVIIQQGKISFDSVELEDLAHDHTIIMRLGGYLASKNAFARARKEINPDPKTEAQVYSKLSAVYRREIDGIDQPSLLEYVLLNYSDLQVRTLASIMGQMSAMTTAMDARMIISQNDITDYETQQKKHQKEIDSILKSMSNTTDGPRLSELAKQMVDLSQQMNSDQEAYQKGLIQIPIDPTDVCRFTENYIQLRIQEEMDGRSGSLKEAPRPKFPEIMAAGYLNGAISGEELLQVLNLPVMMEYYPTFWEKAGKVALGVTRFVSPLIPTYGYYVGLAFMVYDSLDKKGDENEKAAASSRLIR